MIALTLILTFATSYYANAVDMNHEYSETDIANPSLLNVNYDLKSIEVAVDDTDTNILYVWLVFNKPITASQFVYTTKHPWATVLIYRSLPTKMGNNTEDFRISTNSTQRYVSNDEIDAYASGNSFSRGTKSALSFCKPKTWTNLDSNVNWIGFSIDMNCAGIPDSFYVAGYVDPDGSNANSINDFDYAPDDPFFYQVFDYDVNNGPADGSSLMSQEITFEQIAPISITKKYAYVTVWSDSGLDVFVESLTPKICQVTNNYDTIKLISKGQCSLMASQEGDEEYDPAENVIMYFDILGTTPTKKVTAKKIVPKPAPIAKKSPKPIAKK